MKVVSSLKLYGMYFLWLLPLFFVLHGFTENFPVISIGEAAELLLIYLATAVVLFGLSYLCFRSKTKATFFAFFLLAFQLLFGAVHDTLKGWFPNLFLSKYTFLLVAVTATSIWLFVFLRKHQITFRRPAIYLNAVLLLLIGVDTAVLVAKLIAASSKNVATTSYAQTGSRRPNVYLIILDEYAGRAEMNDILHFDNSAYERALANRGFQIINHPSSNYNYTPYSLASIFTMGYLNGVTTTSSDFNNRKVVFDRINHNRVTRIFGGMGYRFVNCSLFDFAGIAPMYQNNDFILTGKRILTSQTFTSRLRRDLWYHLIVGFNFEWAQKDFLRVQKQQIADAYGRTIQEAANQANDPKFVYSHFMMPHHPFLYDEHGEEIPFDKAMTHDSTYYMGFLKYANQFSLKLVDSILAKDKTKPIVIVMSDHGYREYDKELPAWYNFNNIITVRNSAPLPDSLTNVNLFRILLNNNYGTSLPLLKDSTIFMTE